MGIGLALQAVGLAWIAAVSTPTTPYIDLVLPFALSGMGMALFFAPVANVVLVAVRTVEEGQASGANNAIRELGGVFGVAVLASVFAHYGGYTSGTSFVDGMDPPCTSAPVSSRSARSPRSRSSGSRSAPRRSSTSSPRSRLPPECGYACGSRPAATRRPRLPRRRARPNEPRSDVACAIAADERRADQQPDVAERRHGGDGARRLAPAAAPKTIGAFSETPSAAEREPDERDRCARRDRGDDAARRRRARPRRRAALGRRGGWPGRRSVPPPSTRRRRPARARSPPAPRAAGARGRARSSSRSRPRRRTQPRRSSPMKTSTRAKSSPFDSATESGALSVAVAEADEHDHARDDEQDRLAA